MADLFHEFPISVPSDRAFWGVTAPEGLDSWWTLRSSGAPILGTTYELFFGPAYDWRATVTRCVNDLEFEFTLTSADSDWTGTRVRFQFEPKGETTWVQFSHSGWPSANAHFRSSNYCWAMYLRLLKRHLESGDRVPYEQRLDA